MVTTPGLGCLHSTTNSSKDPALGAANPSISSIYMEPDMRPTDTLPTDTTPSAFHHWYNRLPPRPTRRRRYGSSVVNNVWNAWSNWDNAAQGNAAGLLTTMRTQVDNTKLMIDSSGLYGTQKHLVQQLIAEVKQALDALNPALLSQQVSHTSLQSAPMRRTSSEQSVISSNAKAALGCMAYLQDDQLFPGCAATYQYVRERLEQIFRLMDGEYQVADVEGVRRQQQQVLAPSQAAPTALNPDGTMTPYASPTVGLSVPYSSQTPNAAQVQGYAPAQAVGNSASGVGRTPAPSPVAGLEAKSPPWDGTANTTSDGQETVGSGQDWFSTYGTTVEKFAERCSRWLRANGGGQAALVAHLRANTVPENVIAQTMPYVGGG